MSKNNLKQLYFSFIHSYINYANIVWASTHKSKLECLYRHQKHAARLINFEHQTTHAMPLLKDLNTLNIYQLNIYNVLRFMYKCKNNLCPSIFNDIYVMKPKNKYTMRNNKSLYEPPCRTNFNKFCISYRGPYLWNKIIIPFFSSVDLNGYTYSLFSSQLKRLLFLIENTNPFF